MRTIPGLAVFLSSLALLPPYPGHSWDLELEWTGPARCGGDSYHSHSERELSSLCGCGAAAYCSLQDSRWSGLFSDEFGWSGLVLLFQMGLSSGAGCVAVLLAG